ncbi:MAG TPA: efflux RND transporter periplasmic adaptor subunit [Candidatus Eisenbacteria bacterium]|nr:efflux RND transporter periplasmic adaptor subunit [Candidatus Eisenbacteria bacterium]
MRIRRDEPAPTSGTGGQRLWLWLLVLGLVIGLATVVLTRARTRAYTVETAVVERLVPGAAGSVLTATGYVVAQRKAAVASKGTGRLEQLNVEEGDRVRQGQVIGRLEAADVEASLAAARAANTGAKAELERAEAGAQEARLAFDRAKNLLASQLISQSEYDIAEARTRTADADVSAGKAAVASTRANVAYAQVQVENTYIRAPFDGTVLTKNADVGEVVAPFASSASAKGAVVMLADMHSLEVEADVSESNISQVRPGQSALITLDALPAKPYRGRVKKIVPTADRAKATVLTKIEFLNRDEAVLPEMSAKVSFLTEASDSTAGTVVTVIAAPARAVVEKEGRSVVFVVAERQVSEVPVETGQRLGGMIEIRTGLEDGDIVVVDPPNGLRSGGRVQIKS